MNPDREYTSRDGEKLRLHGRSLLFVRNVGHLMQNPAILHQNGRRSSKASWMVLSPLRVPSLALRNPMSVATPAPVPSTS